MKDFSKVNHCWNIQMLSQVNPRIYEMVKYHLKEFKSDLLHFMISSKFNSVNQIIDYRVLDMLQDLQDLMFELWYIKKD